MVTKLKEVDVVVVGLGWTGGILSKELAEAGLKVVALERGAMRWTDMEFKIRSNYEERYGKTFIPADMTIQDWGITYDELEPYYDKFEHTAAISGKAGNVKGEIQPGGNPFEAPRQREYPLPPLTP